jgi:APA family basic amino acid/polyamine antiporter
MATDISAPAGQVAGKAGLFLRKSSGLIRAFSPFDAFAYNIYAVSIIVAAAFSYAIAWQWPDANIPLAIIFNCVGLIPMCIVYAMLATLMPRAGGDYIWQSRVLGGPIGYVLGFLIPVFGTTFFIAGNVAPGPGMVMSPTFLTLGKIFNSQGLITFASWLSTTVGTWWFYVFYCSFAAVVLILGMKFYAKFQKWSFIIGCIAILLWVGILLATSKESFASSFNSFMQSSFNWGDGNAYQKVLSIAQTNGFTGVPLGKTSVWSSFLIGPVIAYAFMAIVWAGNLSGEIGGLKTFKNSLFIYVGGILFCMIVCAGLMWLLISKIGNEFFTSANFIWMGGHGSEMPIAPYFGLFIMAMTKSPLMWLFIVIGLNAWFWIWPTNNSVGSTRVAFAMAYDRMLPGFVAKVSTRYAAPIIAIVIFYAAALIMGWVYFFSAFASLTLVMPLCITIYFSASVLSGVLLPFKNSTKKLYEDSPISKYKIFGAPAITVIGIISLIYNGFLFVLYAVDPRYGTNSLVSYGFIGGIIVLALIIYFVYRAYRRSIGINTDLTYKEIPTD